MLYLTIDLARKGICIVISLCVVVFTAVSVLVGSASREAEGRLAKMVLHALYLVVTGCSATLAVFMAADDFSIMLKHQATAIQALALLLIAGIGFVTALLPWLGGETARTWKPRTYYAAI